MAIDPKKPPVCDPDDIEPAREPKREPPAKDPKMPPAKDPNVPGAPPNEQPQKTR